jgi:hypothetical protein
MTAASSSKSRPAEWPVDRHEHEVAVARVVGHRARVAAQVEGVALIAETLALRLSLRGDDRLARWSLGRGLSDGALRRVFGRPLAVKGRI